MIKSIFIVFFSIFIFSFQKKNEVFGIFEYEQIETRNKSFKSHVVFFDLILNEKFSTYTQKYTEEIDEQYTEESKDGINDVIIVKPKKDEMRIVYNDFTTTNMYFKDIVAFSKIYVKEDKFEMKWNLSDDIKKFGKRECKKATTKFRGRNYTAWYSTEIKTNIGPWKFNNTPGLIFEIYDEEKILHIKLNSLNTKKKSNIISWNNEKISKIINIKEYINLKSKAEDIILERLNSKLPKGSMPFIKNKEQKEIEIFLN